LSKLPFPFAALSATLSAALVDALVDALFVVLSAALFAAGAAHAAPESDADRLTAMINAYRAAPGLCQGAPAEAVAPLAPQGALAAVRITPGMILSAALESAGFAHTQADAISVSGASDLTSAMVAVRQIYCRTLLNPNYTDIGISRSGNDWTIVLARAAPPLPSSTYPDWRDAGGLILDEVNTARESARACGDKYFPPAPPVKWNPQLGDAALNHSSDMATKRYFEHTAKDGSNVGDRARRAGYNWTRIGENIAFGSYTPRETVAGWLTSPGHCANIMDSSFTEMGAAYAVTAEQRAGQIYWTQVFGKQRR
jgi:uncharacterized protein YkwD